MEINKELEIEIINYVYSKNGKIINSHKKKLSIEQISYLMDRFDYVESIEESLFRLHNNIEIRPICPICGNKLSFAGNLRRPYKLTCSLECAKQLNKINRTITNIKKYGVDNPAKNETIKEKQRKKYKENSQKIILKRNNTLQKKYGVENSYQIPEIIKNNKKYFIEKYGVDNPAKLDIIKEKTRQTNIKKYGCAHVLQNKDIRDKIQNTIINRYGIDNPAKSDIIKEKTRQTNIKKYGVACVMSLPHIIQKSHGKETLYKSYLTKKKNNTFNKSKTEDRSYVLLKEKYPDTIRQYRSEEYPFNCDFYIPSIDTYIECNYHWTHGNKPYVGTNDDIEKLNKWKVGNTEFYDEAIKNWTIRDVKKRNTAKENNLNWIEFFKIDELVDWLNMK